MPASYIGANAFVSMTPQPLPAGQSVEIETRAGVTGVGLWLTGSRGKEQTIETVSAYTSFSGAVAGAAAYKAMVGAGAYAIVYGGVACGNYAVLEVTAKAESIASGLYLGTVCLAIVRAQWRLIAV